MNSREYTIAELQSEVVQAWDIEKLQRLKGLIEAEILQRLVMRRQKRKAPRSEGGRDAIQSG